MQEIMMNKVILISKKAQKKLRLARYPALFSSKPEKAWDKVSSSIFSALFALDL
jgi:hypothetical protein